MRKNMYSLLCIAVLMVGMVACKKEDKGDDKKTPSIENEITDTRDGKKYRFIELGAQTWLTTAAKYITTNVTCVNDDCDTYGALYTFEEARTACPAGYHLPTDQEWQILELHLGMLAADTGATLERGAAEGIGTKLKEGGSSGLNLKLSGGINGLQFGEVGTFWTATTDTSDQTKVYYRNVKANQAGVTRLLYNNFSATAEFCVRCIKD